MTKQEQEARLKELARFTTPNMRGFFPDATPGKKSKILTFFDTETDDRNRILSIAAHKVVFNYDKGRFENADSDPGFFRVYNPPNVDKNIARTEGKHGLFGKALELLRIRTGAHYSEVWNESQFEDFKKWVGDSELAGHNIVAADIPWISNVTGRDFNKETYKKGFFDTLHFAKAITGRTQSAALQDLRARYGVNDGLRGHEADSDVVANIKVFEAMIRSNPKSPFVAEALYAMGMKGVQTHWKEGLNLEEGIGQIIHGARGKPLYNLPYQGARDRFGKYLGFSPLDEPQVLDLKEAFDIPEDAFETAAGARGYVSSYYEEGQLRDDRDYDLSNTYQAIKDLESRIGEMHSSVSKPDMAWKRAIDLMKTYVSRSGEGWDSAWIDFNGKERELTAALRSVGYNPSTKDLADPETNMGHTAQSLLRDALIANRSDWYKKQEKIAFKVSNQLKKDKSLFSAQPWWQELADKDVENVDEADLDIYKNLKKEYIKKQDTQRKEQEKQEQYRQKLQGALQFGDISEQAWYQKHKQDKIDEAQRQQEEQEAYRKQIHRAAQEGMIAENRWRLKHQIEKEKEQEEKRTQEKAHRDDVRSAKNQFAELNRGDFRKDEWDSLWLSATSGTKKYAEALKEVNAQHKAEATVLRQISSANNFWNPMSALNLVNQQYSAVKRAASGILPGFIERPLFRFGDAYENIFNVSKARVGSTLTKMQATGNLLGIASTLLPLPAKIVTGIGAGGLTYASQLYGAETEKNITAIGQGISARLNLLGAVNELVLTPLRLFGRGLRSTLGIFQKAASIWSQMYGFPLTNLTSISSAHYGAMTSTDKLMGFQQGATNNMHNSFANQQVQLYSRGQFDENRLVASALLGVFENVYAPMGGNTEEQMADTINHIHNLIRSDPANKQRYMGLAASIHPEYQSILQRMSDLGVEDYRDFNNGRLRSRVGVRFTDIKNGEREEWAQTAFGWSESMRGVGYNLHRIAQPLWTKIGRPAMNGLNEALEAVASGLNGDISWKNVKDKVVAIFKNLWKEISENLGLGEIKWNEVFDTIMGTLRNVFLPLVQTAGNMIIDGFTWLGQQAVTGIAKMIDYLDSINIDTNPIHWLEAINGSRSFTSLIASKDEFKDRMEQGKFSEYNSIETARALHWDGGINALGKTVGKEVEGKPGWYNVNGVLSDLGTADDNLEVYLPTDEDKKKFAVAVATWNKDEEWGNFRGRYTNSQSRLKSVLDSAGFTYTGVKSETEGYVSKFIDSQSKILHDTWNAEVGAVGSIFGGINYGTVKLELDKAVKVVGSNLTPELQRFFNITTNGDGSSTLTLSVAVPAKQQ